MIIDPQEQTKKDNYKLLIGSVLPRPIAFVTSVNEDGVVNAAPFSFYSVVCVDPPMLSITCSRKPGNEPKDTARNILSTGEYVVQVVDRGNVTKVNSSAIDFPPHMSEVQEVGFNLLPSIKVKVPRIKESKVHMECRLHSVLELGSVPDMPDCDLVIGEVVMFHVDESLYDQGRINTTLLDPVGRLAGTEYVALGERFSMKRYTYDKE